MSITSNEEKITLVFSLKKCLNNTYYDISVNNKSLGYEEIFKTEKIKSLQNNSEITFSKKMPLSYYFDKIQKLLFKITKTYKIDSSNYKSNCYERFTTLSSLIASPNSKYERQLVKNKDTEILCIRVERENNNIENKNNSLFDFFKSGVKLSCIISTDFSNSKINPSIEETKVNYISILKRISDFIGAYTNNYKFYAYGFGAKIKHSSSNETVFNLDISKNNSLIQTMEKVVEKFEKCLNENLITPEKSIILSPLIKKITNDIFKSYELRFYNVSFIITRGVVDKDDIKKTIDAIIESNYLPLTIIIIGVGKNDFSEMKKIFGKEPKCHSLGMQKMRDNVIFISLIDDCSNEVDYLIPLCLKELSKQMICFYDLIKSSPKKISENNMKNIEESFNLYNSSICLERSKIVLESELNKINQKISFMLDNNSETIKYKNQINEDEKKQSVNQNLNDINPYKRDQNLSNLSNFSNLSQPSNKQSIEGSALSELSSKKFVNKKPKIYESVLEPNQTKSKVDENNEQKLYTPTPTDSICPDIKNNPFNDNIPKADDKDTLLPPGSICGEMGINFYRKEPKQGQPGKNDYQTRQFNLPNNSIIDQNQKNNFQNPYLNEYNKKKNSGFIGQNNNSSGKKNNKISNGSEFNSTENSENIKSSDNIIFNNYSIDSSHMK